MADADKEAIQRRERLKALRNKRSRHQEVRVAAACPAPCCELRPTHINFDPQYMFIVGGAGGGV